MTRASKPRPIARIRRETRDEHERTERAVEERFFEDRAVDRSDYAGLIAAFAGLYRPLEERLAPAVARHLPSFEHRPRAARLERDLRSLGASHEEIDDLPTVGRERLPDLRSRPSVLGCLYVVEGSQLGHRVLWKRFRDDLDDVAEGADAFFGVDPARTRTRWERFGETFDRRITTGDALRTAVTSARTTFRAYRDWLS